jgi:menaquinone-specific isochorismate synthase
MDRVSLEKELTAVIRAAREKDTQLPAVVDVPSDENDPAGWLARRADSTRCYWRARDGELEIAGAGVAYQSPNGPAVAPVSRPVSRLSGSPHFFFVDRFDPGGGWRDFPAGLCFVPRISVVRERGRAFKRLVVPAAPESRPEQLADEIVKLSASGGAASAAPPDYELPAPVALRHVPGPGRWRRGVENCLGEIARGSVQKVVLARRTDYTFPSPVDPVRLMTALRASHPGCYTFLAQTGPGKAFISVTPERLFRREGNQIRIDALSSTVRRGATASEDTALEHFLARDPKEKLEHNYVVEGITKSIDPLCAGTPRTGETTVLKLKTIQHLKTPVCGTLGPDAGDDGILAVLHPTPAVGGSPREAALESIGRHEPFKRGWYAAPVGIISEDRVELAVAIRSVVVRDRTVSVFAGAGIVSGSDPDAEWRELDAKNVLTPLWNRQVQT